MHILEIPSFFPPLGGEFCIEQSRALAARGHKVRIIACVQLGITVNRSFYFSAPHGRWWEENNGIETYKTYMLGMPKCVRYNYSHWIKTVESMYQEYCQHFGTPDIIHAHCCKYAGMAAQRISQKHGVPYVITEHLHSVLFEEDFGKGWTKHQWLKPMLRSAYRDAKCVIPVSHEQLTDIEPFFGTDYNHHVISNIIDTDFFAFRQREASSDRPFRFCCLARADIIGKGYDVLAEAWHDMADAELHIAGRDTDGDAMQQLMSGLQDIHIHGNLDKEGVRQLLYHCDALVLPSRREAQPLVILEALSTGIPVVTTDVITSSERSMNGVITSVTGNAASLHDSLRQCMKLRPSASYHKQVCMMAAPDVVAQQIEQTMK